MRARIIRSVTRSFDSLIYLVVGESGEAVLIDAGAGSFLRVAYWEDRGYVITHVLITHGHFDHVCDVGKIRSLAGAAVVMGAEDIDLLDNAGSLCRYYGFGWGGAEVDTGLVGDAEFEAAGFLIKAIHTPGHTMGSYSYYFPELGVVFTGDTLFRGTIGRTDFPTGNDVLMAGSLRRLLTLPKETVVYPGHGPPTTIGNEEELMLELIPVLERSERGMAEG